jgi:serine O-acetyltransferase
MDLYTWLVYARQRPVAGKLAYYALKLLGIELPCSVSVGEGLELAHGGFGVVVHSKSTIGKRVKIYPGVTLGRADIYRPAEASRFEGIVVEDDAILCPGAKVLCKEGGVPARCVGKRE